MSRSLLEPALGSVLREGNLRTTLPRDLLAGAIVAVVALPLSIAIGIASGLTPQQGLFTAVVAGFVISALSGSRVQVGGPTGAFIVLVFQIVHEHGYEGLAVATFMAGGILMLMGLARMGRVIQYIPYPVTVGFTAGIAVVILASQLGDLTGIRVQDPPAEFVHKLRALIESAPGVEPSSAMVGIGSLVVLLIWPRLTRRVPGAFVVVVLMTALVAVFDVPAATIGSRFGEIPRALPAPRLPDLDWELVRDMIQPATAIALLAGIESLLSAVIADGMTGRRHDPNMELVAQGMANVVSPLFLGLPATGAIARTATNVKNGGSTPVAGMAHALALLVMMMLLGPWVAAIPLATLAAVLTVVAVHMGEWRLFRTIVRASRGDAIVLLTTFLLTVFTDLVLAIEVGVVLAALLFTKRMADIAEVEALSTGNGSSPDTVDVPEGVEVFEIHGPFFFGAADKFKSALHVVGRTPRVLILRLRYVPTIDSTGLHALEDVLDKTRREGTELVLSGVRPRLLAVLRRSGFHDRVGAANVLPDIDAAVERAREILSA